MLTTDKKAKLKSTLQDAQLSQARNNLHTGTAYLADDSTVKKALTLELEALKDDEPAQLKLLNDNNLKHPIWEGELKAGFSAINHSDINSNVIPESVSTGLSRYKFLSQKSPATIGQYLNNDEMEFYASMQVLTEAGGMEEKEALLRVKQVFSDPTDSLGTYRTSVKKQEVDTLLDPWLVGNDYPLDAKRDVAKLAHLLSALGRTADEAKNEAIERVQSRYIEYGNSYIKKTDRIPPKETLDEMNETFVNHFLSNNPELDLDSDDVSLMPLTADNLTWGIVDKYQGAVLDKDSNTFTFHYNDMVKAFQDLKLEETEKENTQNFINTKTREKNKLKSELRKADKYQRTTPKSAGSAFIFPKKFQELSEDTVLSDGQTVAQKRKSIEEIDKLINQLQESE